MRRAAIPALVAGSFALLGGTAPVGSVAAAATRCPQGIDVEVGAAKADITPTRWPVGEAAYGIGRLGGSAAHPFYARVVAVRSCRDGATIVLGGLDSQGYFTAYKEDPAGTVLDPSLGYGTTGIRLTAARLTGVPADHIELSATHTHNSPDSVGVWGGGSVANNKAPYLSRVKAQTVRAIVAAVKDLQPARLTAGTADVSSMLSTYNQVRNDPAHFPTDHTLRVLQAVSAQGCRPIATLINAGIHATVAGPLHGAHGLDVIDPDWPGRVATDTERSLPGDLAVVIPGGVGRTGPAFPTGTDPHAHNDLVAIAAYGDVLFRRVATALATAQPVAAGPVRVLDTRLHEELAEPALIPLFFDEQGVPGPPGSTAPTIGGVMRSILPPYTIATTLTAETQTFRIGSVLLNGVPGEAYPENATELAARVRSGTIPPFTLAMANDQLGYTPPTFEFPLVALVDGGDEGVFTINTHFGDDLINLHLQNARALGFATTGSEPYLGTGPVVPTDQQKPPPDRSLAEPRELPLSLPCTSAGVAARPVLGGAGAGVAAGGVLPRTGPAPAVAAAALLALSAAGVLRRVARRSAFATSAAAGPRRSGRRSVGHVDDAQLEELVLPDAGALRAWLMDHHSTCSGVWLVLGRKGGAVTTLTWQQAVDEALCFGWIDGQKRSRDAETSSVRFTPRRSDSSWSQRNVDHVARLEAEGRMQPPGRAAVDAAKADGRYEAAYRPQSEAKMPADLMAAIAAVPAAQAMFDVLTAANRYALIYRVGSVKRAETRARKIVDIVEILARHEAPHPQRARPAT